MKRGKKYNKKAQQLLGMPFSMIFSIILIVFFLVVAVIAINYFLGLKKCTQIGLFKDGLDNQISKAWNSEEYSFVYTANLPGNLKYVCFADFSKTFSGSIYGTDVEDDFNLYGNEDANLLFSPEKESCDLGIQSLKHIDITEITKTNNPYCVKIENGVVSIKISKELNQGLVVLK